MADKNLYGLRARPFGVGTFPFGAIILDCINTNRTETGYYNVVETKEPLTREEIVSYELVPVDMDFIEIFEEH